MVQQQKPFVQGKVVMDGEFFHFVLPLEKKGGMQNSLWKTACEQEFFGPFGAGVRSIRYSHSRKINTF